jgi:hypothetical protein
MPAAWQLAAPTLAAAWRAAEVEWHASAHRGLAAVRALPQHALAGAALLSAGVASLSAGVASLSAGAALLSVGAVLLPAGAALLSADAVLLSAGGVLLSDPDVSPSVAASTAGA